MNDKNNVNLESGETLAENKLIILYLMHNAKCSLSNLQILKLLYDFEGFNYYYFRRMFTEKTGLSVKDYIQQ